jgi:L-2-hydroxyglutarate oxidase LhgO
MQKGLSMAIIGAGVSGLTLAASLMKYSSLSITIIEK